MRDGVASLTQADVTTAGFRAFNGATLDPSIRIFGPGATVAQDLEPEYIAVSHDSKTAWVTLQENNALGIIDLKEKRVTKLVGLGFKNHNVAGAGLDSSDRDNHANAIEPRPVLGMYQPDGIAALQHRDQTYLVTANEGDVREWKGVAQPGVTTATQHRGQRVSALTLDRCGVPERGDAEGNAVLGRLNVTLYNGNTDADAGVRTAVLVRRAVVLGAGTRRGGSGVRQRRRRSSGSPQLRNPDVLQREPHEQREHRRTRTTGRTTAAATTRDRSRRTSRSPGSSAASSRSSCSSASAA